MDQQFHDDIRGVQKKIQELMEAVDKLIIDVENKEEEK